MPFMQNVCTLYVYIQEYIYGYENCFRTAQCIVSVTEILEL